MEQHIHIQFLKKIKVYTLNGPSYLIKEKHKKKMYNVDANNFPKATEKKTGKVQNIGRQEEEEKKTLIVNMRPSPPSVCTI